MEEKQKKEAEEARKKVEETKRKLEEAIKKLLLKEKSGKEEIERLRWKNKPAKKERKEREEKDRKYAEWLEARRAFDNTGSGGGGRTSMGDGQ